jgi:serine/threonine-protein kinase
MAEPRMLGDRYEIEEKLGRGGMATVYRGRDRVLGRPVAVKVLAQKYADDEKFVTRFRREAQASARLNHENIVSVFDTGDTDGQHYIVMELVEGETLADLLKREGKLSPERAARIASLVARALHAAHGEGIVHRDVKPGNVMLTPAGEVKVMDFGIARAATDETLTQTGMVLGTASYLSPEQSRGDSVDHRSDLYALGCVIYEMLTGEPPFTGGSPLSVAYKHVNDAPQPVSQVNPSVPPGLEAVVMRALEKDPDARFPSADSMRQAMTDAVAEKTTEPLGGDTAVLPTPTEPLPRAPAGVDRRAWILVGLLAAVLVAATIVALALTGDEGRRPEGQTSPTEQPPPPEPPPAVAPSVEGELLELQEGVNVAVQAGLVSSEAGSKIVEEAGKAVEEYFKGKFPDAMKHLGEAEATVYAEGAVASEDQAASLVAAIGELRAAMQANPFPVPIEETPPPEGDGDGDD